MIGLGLKESSHFYIVILIKEYFVDYFFFVVNEDGWHFYCDIMGRVSWYKSQSLGNDEAVS